MKKLLSIFLITLNLTTSCKKDMDDIVVYQTTFKNADLWPVGTYNFYSFNINQDKYEIEVKSPNCYAYAIAPYENINFDYAIAVDCSMFLEDSTKQGAMGIIYNYFSESYFTFFYLYNDGYFEVIKKEASSYKILVQSILGRDIIKSQGKTNRIEVIQKSTSTEFILNNTLIGVISIGRDYPSVMAGVVTESVGGSKFTGVKVLFDNFIIRRI